MPPKGASDNLKAHIPVLYCEHSIKEIWHLLGIKKMLVYKVLNWYQQFGNILNIRIHALRDHDGLMGANQVQTQWVFWIDLPTMYLVGRQLIYQN